MPNPHCQPDPALPRAIDRPALVSHGAPERCYGPPAPSTARRRCKAAGWRLCARLALIEGMGRTLPAQLIERLLALIDAHARGKMAAEPHPHLFENQ
ncbi:MAG: hypothetical protein QFF03_15050 [Pseudomonadota bacterium]|nr:hypothetical protein [Pseudomonadota bacterium]